MIRAMPRSAGELVAIRDSVSLVGRLSDSLIRVGPLSLGLDGVMSWIPGIGEIYSTVAGGFILLQGWRAGVPISVLGAAAAILALRTGATAVPLLGSVFADLFMAHKWAAAMVVAAINQRLSEAPVQTGWESWTGGRQTGRPLEQGVELV